MLNSNGIMAHFKLLNEKYATCVALVLLGLVKLLLGERADALHSNELMTHGTLFALVVPPHPAAVPLPSPSGKGDKCNSNFLL